MSHQRKYHIITFGCQMNEHDSEMISGILEQKGYLKSEDVNDSDVVIVNTCSIRKKAEDKFYSQVGRFVSLKKKKPHIKIGIVGCVAQQEGKKILHRYNNVDFVLGTMQLNKLLEDDPFNLKGVFIEYTDCIKEINFVKRKSNIKALVNIMYGCNNYCSYCVVPYTRGPEKSREMQSIIDEIKRLADNGYKEIMLLGQNVNSYKSGKVDFVDLLNEIEKIEGIERIRFMTSHPKDLSDSLIRCFRDLSKLCEHIHLPLQSGSSKILNLMNRGYTYQDYLNIILKLRAYVPDIAITTDIISGFPYEDEDNHNETLKALREIQFDGIFSFKYSKRPGTKASLFDNQIDENTKNRRLHEINSLQDTITDEKNKKYKGETVEVLVDGVSDKSDFDFMGRTRNNKIVYIKTLKELNIGDIVNVHINTPKRHCLEGEV